MFCQLKVVGRTSSFQFKNKSDDLRTIGKALGVAHVVEGSVRRSGDRIRVTAQLIDTRDETHLWSESLMSTSVAAECICGIARMEIDFPARWAWHDHSVASRHAHGAAYATYVGSWRSRFRITDGSTKITRFENPTAGTVRGFCTRCGTPLYYERTRSPHMVNIPRTLQNAHGPGGSVSSRHRRDDGVGLLG
jgi:hypothetical protein